MMRFKNNAFTLIEAMISIAVIGIVLTPLFVTQGTVMSNVAQYANRLQRTFGAELFMLKSRDDAGNERQFTIEKKTQAPTARMKYQMASIKKESALKNFDDMLAEQVTVEWDEGVNKRSDTLVNFIYKPKPVSEKK